MGKSIDKNSIIGVLSILFLIMFPHYVPLPFYSYAIVCFLLILFLLKREHQKLSDIGFSKNRFTAKALFLGFISAVLLFCFNRWCYLPFINHFWKELVGTYTEYNFIQNHPINFIITLVAAWLVGGFYEEIVFRGYIHTTIQNMVKKYSYSFWIAGITTSLLFGLYHIQQGIFGVVSSLIGGLLWTCLLKYSKGNLWYSILSHAIYDTIVLTLIYLGKF